MKDPLFTNKLAFCILFALLLFFGLPQIAGALFGGGHGGGHHGDLELAYPIEYEVEASTGGEKAVEDLGSMMAEVALPAASRRVALCKSCHTFEEGGANGTGPNLWNIVGREVGTVAGFNYSNALKEFGGTWTYERLEKYIENSQGYVPGTAMVQRFPKASQRAEVLVYLGSLSNNPMPFPEPLTTTTAEEDHSEDHDEGESH